MIVYLNTWYVCDIPLYREKDDIIMIRQNLHKFPGEEDGCDMRRG